MNNYNKLRHLLPGLFVSFLMLPACSSDDVQKIVDEVVGDVTVSGQLTSSANPSGEQDVSVKGIYGGVLGDTDSVTTDASGMYSLVILKDTPVSLQASKTGFVTLNSATDSLSADESGFDIEMVTVDDANDAIDQVFPAQKIDGFAWLVVNVVDSADAEVGGVKITTTGDPTETAATDCDGGNISADTTYTDDPCIPERPGPMYFAHFDTDSAEITVTAEGIGTQLAPVRRGEVTYLEFVQ